MEQNQRQQFGNIVGFKTDNKTQTASIQHNHIPRNAQIPDSLAPKQEKFSYSIDGQNHHTTRYM